ncbi:MAG TPA: hypothetical protein VNQ55_11770 [Parapedobacter sp.]|nr:hypothetical protein [Parapedobacter sp.]
MKHYFLLIGCLMFAWAPLSGQHRPSVFIGAGPGKFSLTGGAYLPFMNKTGFSFGVQAAGDYLTTGTKGVPAVAPFDIAGGLGTTTATTVGSTGDRAFGVGFGPRADFSLGKHLVVSPIFQVGWGKVSQASAVVTQRVSTGEAFVEREIYAREEYMADGLYYAPKMRLSVPLGKRLSVWAEGGYAFQRAELRERRLQIAGRELEDGTVIYDVGGFIEGKVQEEVSSRRWEALSGRAGLSLALGGKKGNKNKKARTFPVPTKPSRSSGLDNREHEKGDDRKLVAKAPVNNSQYRDSRELRALTWELLGATVTNPRYVVEVVKVDGKGRPQRSYAGKSTVPHLDVTSLEAGGLADGQYRWQVTEVTTGLSSAPRFFNITNCAVDLSIANETIECLGYEGEDRKYRICFETTYSSPSGDLTFNDPASDLTLYDQNYNALSYTLVGTNTTLVSQPGANASTVSYCMEVTVPPSTSAIGLGLQGDDLDPSPVLCQPGVSISFDELPDCRCDECDSMEVSFAGMGISVSASDPAQFVVSGGVNVSQPVYGVEIQVQSYSYSDNPGGCSTGVTSVQTSGMFLPAGSTVNGSSDLQANGLTKVVRYMSSSPLTGSIPVHLLLGLPAPLPGMDADCCALSYEVCLKVSVFYEDGTCKVCTFTHCFQFDNQ